MYLKRTGAKMKKCTQRAAFSRLPASVNFGLSAGGNYAEQGLPLAFAAQHDWPVWLFERGLVERLQQRAINQRGVAWQYEHPGVASSCKTAAYSCKGAGESLLFIANQSIGIGRVAGSIAVAGQQEVVCQWLNGLMQPCNQWASLPFDQSFVLSSHALPTATRQKQDGAGRQ
ncbi:MAG: hypothetical protein BCV62_21495 [Pseudomonas sp. K35]|nr:MAG: hypothetical protein BCV62_21495 [Pseudomonas sp. K35]